MDNMFTMMLGIIILMLFFMSSQKATNNNIDEIEIESITKEIKKLNKLSERLEIIENQLEDHNKFISNLEKVMKSGLLEKDV